MTEEKPAGSPELIEIHDALGEPHAYTIYPFASEEGALLMFELIGFGGGALGTLLQSGLGGLIAGESGAKDLLDDPEALAKLSAEVDFGAVGSQLAEQLGQSRKSLALVKRLLGNTLRDGVPVSKVWATAYQANYAELLLATFHAIRVNRLFPLPATS